MNTKNLYDNRWTIFGLLSIFFLFQFCAGVQPMKSFLHEFSQEAHPWSHERFDVGKDKFSFAVVSDLFGGERPGIFNVAIEQINLLRPEFIMSVGDLIDGGTEDVAKLQNEWKEFDAKRSNAIAPFFHVGGNHDLTNPTMRTVWEEKHGSRYYHFVYNNVLFLILDSEDYEEQRMKEIYKARAIAIEILDGDDPSKAVEAAYFKMPERRTGEISEKQSEYFENVLKENTDVKWTFLFMHKPVWMREGMGSLARIETALGDRPYTSINGHFHTYSHTIRNERDYIMLGTTGGSQNAESDMAYDHFAMITMTTKGPAIANLKLEGVLNKYGEIPAGGKDLCFQASKCTFE